MPFKIRAQFNHLKSEHVWYLKPHCIDIPFVFLSLCSVWEIPKKKEHYLRLLPPHKASTHPLPLPVPLQNLWTAPKWPSSILVLYFLPHAAYFCFTWMTSCVHLKKIELVIWCWYFTGRMETISTRKKGNKRKGMVNTYHAK